MICARTPWNPGPGGETNFIIGITVSPTLTPRIACEHWMLIHICHSHSWPCAPDPESIKCGKTLLFALSCWQPPLWRMPLNCRGFPENKNSIIWWWKQAVYTREYFYVQWTGKKWETRLHAVHPCLPICRICGGWSGWPQQLPDCLSSTMGIHAIVPLSYIPTSDGYWRYRSSATGSEGHRNHLPADMGLPLQLEMYWWPLTDSHVRVGWDNAVL